MTRGLDISVFLKMAGDLAKPMKDAENKVKASTDRMKKSMSLSLKLGGAGAVASGIKMATDGLINNFTASYKEVQKASGDLRSLGMKDMQAVIKQGQNLQQTYVGLSTEAFVRAAYDIKSGVSSLTDEGVAAMTASALTVAKATKGVPENMTSLFATSYGIFKKQFSEMSDADWGDMFGAALSKSVQQFKTDGAKMQQAIESAGAGATNFGMAMTEQMTLLGMMQQQMQAGEAGTALKSFAANAARAHEAFSKMKVTEKHPVRVRVIDEKGMLRKMPDILADLKARYGETLSTVEAAEISKAFGTEEAMKLIQALYGQEEAVRANAAALDDAARQGAKFTQNMAANVDDYDGASWELLAQKMDVVKQKIGAGLLPALDKLAPVFASMAEKLGDFISKNPELVAGLGAAIVGLSGIATVAAPVLFAFSSLTAAFGVVRHGSTLLGLALRGTDKKAGLLSRGVKLLGGSFGVLKTAVIGIGRVLMANPIGLAITAIALGAYLIYQHWDAVKPYFEAIWNGIQTAISTVWSWIKSAFDWDPLATISGLWDGVSTALSGPIEDAKTAIDTAWAAITSLFDGGWPQISEFDWNSVISVFTWDNALTALDWMSWLSPIRWLDFIPGFEWKNVLSDKGLDRAWKSVSDWFGKIDWKGIIPEISFPDIGGWLGINKDAASAVDRHAKALKGLSDNSALAVNAIAELSATQQNQLGFEANEGLAASQRQIEELQSNIAKKAGKTAFVMGGWEEGEKLAQQLANQTISLDQFQKKMQETIALGGDQSTAKEMLKMSFELAKAQGDAEQFEQTLKNIKMANTGEVPVAAPDIQSPETLVDAARVADKLTQQYPALNAAALETQAAVTSSITQMTTQLKAIDFTSEGQRIMRTLAAGIRSQAQEVSNAIRHTLPGSSGLNVAGSTPAPIQARARGGSYGPGWLLTGEQGPELRYESEGGFVAHFGLLKQMVNMAARARSLMQNITPPASVAFAEANTHSAFGNVEQAAAQMMSTSQSTSVSMAPIYHVTISGEASHEQEERLRQLLQEHDREQQLEMERYLND